MVDDGVIPRPWPKRLPFALVLTVGLLVARVATSSAREAEQAQAPRLL